MGREADEEAPLIIDGTRNSRTGSIGPDGGRVSTRSSTGGGSRSSGNNRESGMGGGGGGVDTVAGGGDPIRHIYANSAIPDRRGVSIEINDLSIVHTPTVAESLAKWWKSPSIIDTLCRRREGQQHGVWPCAAEPFIVVRSAIAAFGPAQIHAITTTSPASAEALVGILLGEERINEGSITVNGAPIPDFFRLHCGIVDQRASWSFDNLTVRENLMFAARTRRPMERTDVFEERSSYLARLFHLDVAEKSEKLSIMMRLRLDIAMELMTDPAVLVLVHPFDRLDRHSHAQLSNTLIVAATVLQKTVIVTMSSLPLTLVPALDTVLLLAADGHCLYSGSREGLFTYFTKLQLPPLVQHKNRSRTNSRPPQSPAVVAGGGSTTTPTPTYDKLPPAASSVPPTPGAGAGGQPVHSTEALVRFDENTADAVMDQVQAWATSPAALSRYASKFYDSDERRHLVRGIAGIRRGGGTSPTTLSPPGALPAGGGAGGGGGSDGDMTPTAGGNSQRQLKRGGGGSDQELATDRGNNGSMAASSSPPNYGSTADTSGRFSPDGGGGQFPGGGGAYGLNSSVTRELVSPVNPASAYAAWFIALFEYVSTAIKSALTYVETYVYWLCLLLVLTFCAWLLGKQQVGTASQNIEGIFFLLFTVTTLINMAALRDIYIGKRRYHMMKRGGVLGSLRYFIVNLTEVLVSRTVLALCVALTCRIMIPDVNIEVFVTSVALLSFAHYSLLFMCCTLSPEPWLANVAVSIYTGFSLLFAGFFLNVNTQGVYYLSQGSIVRYAYGISVQTYLGQLPDRARENEELNSLGFEADQLSTFYTVLITVSAAAWVIVMIKLKSVDC